LDSPFAVNQSETGSGKFFFQSHPDFLIALDDDVCIVDISSVAARELQQETGTLPVAGTPMQHFIDPAAYENFLAHFQKAWAGADVFPVLTGPHCIHFITRLYPLRDASGQVIAVAYQRTPRASVPALPEEGRNAFRLKMLLDRGDLGWWDLDLKTKIVSGDNYWWSITGYPPGSFTNASEFASALQHPGDVHIIREAFEKASKEAADSFECEIRIIHKNGRVVPVLIRGHIVREETGIPVWISGTMVDLTEKRKADNDREYSENYLRTIFQNTETGYIFLDINLHVLSFNQKAESIAYRLNHKMLETGGRILDFVSTENLENFTRALYEAYEGQRIEYERCKMSGSNDDEWFYFRLSPVFNLAGKVVNVIMTIEDITDRKRDEIQLNKSFELVSAQNKRLLSFSYIVSHNLRSHASNITSIVEFLSDADTEQERNEMIDHLKTVSQSLDETLSNLNDIISIQTSINPIFEPLLVSPFIRKAIDVLRDQIYRKDATIVNNVGNDAVINYNPAYMESIILNFLSNALKYSHPDRKPVVNVNSAFENGKFILIFEDNGIGIDLKKNGDKLFGLYKTFNGNPDARGLGLFITRNQVEYMGGKIEVESEPEIGTKFKIYF
jgi:diguanylate cyclase